MGTDMELELKGAQLGSSNFKDWGDLSLQVSFAPFLP